MSIVDFQKRITYQGDLKKLLNKVCSDYEIGDHISHEVILNGYEDFNLMLETNQGKYFVKIFAKFRGAEDCNRYINIIENVLFAGVQHPSLYSSSQGKMYKTSIDGSDINLCVLEYIDGEILYKNNEVLRTDEIKYIVKQASIIN